ncbi:MAG: VanZ family protein [Anaerolineae bacterium]|nr:VanZ family protein [Anaerolineae bacterium]
MSQQISLPRLRRLLFRWLPPLLWMAVIYLASDQSTLPQLEEPWLDVILKKTAHFLEYALLAFLWWRALSGSGPRALWPLIVSGLISVLYAVSDEYHQTFVPGRHGQLWDLGVDSAGVLCALWLIWQRDRSRPRT